MHGAINDKAVCVQSRRQSVTLELKVVESRVKVPFVKKLDLLADKIINQQTA